MTPSPAVCREKFLFAVFLVCVPALCFAQADRDSPLRARQVMEALAAAYPGRVEKAEFWDGDWTVVMQGVRYYYCGARLLPEELRGRAADYSPQPFYNYAAQLPDWKTPTDEEAERFRTLTDNRSRNPPRRSPHFFDALWQARTYAEAQKRIKSIVFLGFSVNAHETIHGELASVEKQIREDAKNDTGVRAWVNGIRAVGSWNWRAVADIPSRSYHAYGVAIDIRPQSVRGKQVYWLWTAGHKREWWNTPYSARLHPPDKVIKAFESRGFIWGGKWLFFDTMHFEYRPEIFILNESNSLH